MKRIKILCLATMLPLLAMAGSSSDDDFGVWAETGIQKSLSRQWSVGVSTELRAEQNTRWSIGADVGYKPSKYFRLGAGYSFLYRFKPENRREH